MNEDNQRNALGIEIQQEKACWLNFICLLNLPEFGSASTSGLQCISSSPFTLAPSKLAANFIPGTKQTHNSSLFEICGHEKYFVFVYLTLDAFTSWHNRFSASSA